MFTNELNELKNQQKSTMPKKSVNKRQLAKSVSSPIHNGSSSISSSREYQELPAINFNDPLTNNTNYSTIPPLIQHQFNNLDDLNQMDQNQLQQIIANQFLINELGKALLLKDLNARGPCCVEDESIIESCLSADTQFLNANAVDYSLIGLNAFNPIGLNHPPGFNPNHNTIYEEDSTTPSLDELVNNPLNKPKPLWPTEPAAKVTVTESKLDSTAESVENNNSNGETASNSSFLPWNSMLLNEYHNSILNDDLNKLDLINTDMTENEIKKLWSSDFNLESKD